jgi:replicative DNA helicase
LVLRYEADAKAAKEGRQRVLRVGLSLIDGGMMGLRPGELTTLIGAGGSGKSTLVLFLAKMLAEKGVHSLFFSAEMSATQVAEKSLYAESGINMLSPDPVSIEKLQQGLRAITENFGHRVHVHNKTRVRYSTAVGIAKRLVREKALGVVFFDHLRRMVPEGYQRSQYEKVSAGISQMKDLCREADVPVVVLTHLSRDTKDNPEPTLDLIRDSGQVSEESDHVLGLWRPSEHSTYTWLSLLKSRNTGYKGKVRMHFDPLTQRFREEFG